MGTRNWVFAVVGLIVFMALSFFAGFAISFVRETPKGITDDAGNLGKLTSLEVSSDMMDPNTVIVALASKRRYSPQEMAVSTLQATKKLASAGQLLDKWLKVKFSHRFYDRKIEFIVSTETIKGKNSGKTGNIDFWNQALSTLPGLRQTGRMFGGVDGFIELFRSLEPEAEVMFANRTLAVTSRSRLDWKENCLGLVMSVQACAQAAGFYPDRIDIKVGDGDRMLVVEIAGADLKSLMQGYLTPQEFQTRIVMGWE